jgi:Cilia- and flagella-associated protein 54
MDADKFTKNDQNIKRKDTVEVVVDILNRLKATAEEVNKMAQELREKLYHITFNATVLIYNLCRILREGSFSKEATQFLAFNVLCLDNNLILTTAKYLDWRVMNYIELARAYADVAAYKAATRVVSYGI